MTLAKRPSQSDMEGNTMSNDTDTYVVKEKVFLNAVRSNKKYKFKKKPEGKKPSYVRPHLSKIKFD